MIKFRAWDKRENTMRDVAVLHFTKGGKVNSIEYWKTPSESKSYHVRNLILMQSTGLKDKNGVEIFEGDIAETRKSDLSNTPFEMVGGVVTYDSDYGMFKLVRKYGSKFHPFTIWLTNVEVIGNIHANPELLNSGIE